MRCPGLHCPGCGDSGRGLATLGAVVLAAVAVEVILQAIWWITGVTVVFLVLGLTAGVLLSRATGRREAAFGAELERTRPERWQALGIAPGPQVTAARRPAVEVPRRRVIPGHVIITKEKP